MSSERESSEIRVVQIKNDSELCITENCRESENHVLGIHLNMFFREILISNIITSITFMDCLGVDHTTIGVISETCPL